MEHKNIHLADYRPPAYTVTDVFLDFDLNDQRTRVVSRLEIERRQERPAPLKLDGQDLRLTGLTLDGRKLGKGEYRLDGESLIIDEVPAAFSLEVKTEIDPAANSSLSGLYKSGDLFCTQCEPQGFRRITYHLDRPDVMARFTSKITAPKERYPILLAGGNLIEKSDLPDGRHTWLWRDPFPKPSYLYALVAGDLDLLQDSYKTASGKMVDLRIYCDKGKAARCRHAMESLKKAMRWDEQAFGLEYDLDTYLIVAVDSFNMGAMENKGLNIFNSALILYDPSSATDEDFLSIESVIAHEYFHNWTGNRVTCRDWFQLTLKEGLTVFRDQQFSAAMNSRAVVRIGNVGRLRKYQFPEDASAMAHPIRPRTYMEIDNFYTATVYEKGAEVIRMLHTLLGEKGFRRGMDKYFALFDGQAVTVEDFLHAMSAAGDIDLNHFAKWYDQVGTPEVSASWEHDPDSRTLTLRLRQSTEEPLLIPLRVGPVGAQGKLVLLDQESATVTFKDVDHPTAPSLNRDFSAPVKVNADYSDTELGLMLSSDSDPFNRYEASQLLAARLIHQLVATGQNTVAGQSLDPWGGLLAEADLADAHFVSLCLRLPDEALLHQHYRPVDFQAVGQARLNLARSLARTFRRQWRELYDNLQGRSTIGKRALKNSALSYLALLEEEESAQLCYGQFCRADNMTDCLAALNCLANLDIPLRNQALGEFRAKWKDENLVIQKWLALQACSHLPDTLERVISLQDDPAYDPGVPNFFRALIGRFARNHIHFNHPAGRGYRFVADNILAMDKKNPSTAAALTCAFECAHRMDDKLRSLAHGQLVRILDAKPSKNVYEVARKILG